MNYEKIIYQSLSGKAKEQYNFQKVSAILADYGYATYWLNVDTEAADFIAVHFSGIDVLKVQLKSRITIAHKYIGKEIYICFPYKLNYFVLKHDRLLELIETHTNWMSTKSWQGRNKSYSSISINKALLNAIEPYKL